MEIKDNFISTNGVTYDNVREISFLRKNLFGNLGTLVNETKRDVFDYFRPNAFDIDDRGVYIYKSKYDNNKALRIYKCFMDYNFNGDRDDVLISKLQELQPLIKLTNFPMGVVTLDGKIIGQEIPFYNDYSSLYSIKNDLYIVDMLNIYKRCLIILKELIDNGIYYVDIHARNLVVNKDLDVKLVDFEYNLIKFNNPDTEKITMQYFCDMINFINSRTYHYDLFDKPECIDDAFDKLYKYEKKILLNTNK